jgi:L-2-hydroxyglutarate oxidase
VLESTSQQGSRQTRTTAASFTAASTTRRNVESTLCIEGRRLLCAFCASHGVPHEKCGKLIVAADDSEIPRLEKLYKTGVDNGVEGLTLVDRSFIATREPNIRAVAAIFSPETGIVEAEALVRALHRASESDDVIFLPGTTLLGADSSSDGITLRTAREKILASTVVNAAACGRRLRMLGDDLRSIPSAAVCRLIPSKRSLVNGLIYPCHTPRTWAGRSRHAVDRRERVVQSDH